MSEEKVQNASEAKTPLWLIIVLSIISVLMGFLSSIQNGMNSRMGTALDTGIYCLFYSFATGAGLVLIFRIIEVCLRPDPYRENTLPSSPLDVVSRILYIRSPLSVYFVLPPVIGVLFVLCGTFLTPELGFGLYFVIQILGSLISSVVIDHFALVGMPRSKANWVTGCGLAIAVVGAVLTVVSQIQDSPPSSSDGVTALYCILTFLVGLIFPFQATTNNKLTVESVPTALSSSLMMYFIGLVISFFVALFYSFSDPAAFYNLSDNVKLVPDYAWISGIVGAFFVTLAIFVAPAIGTAFWMALMLAGQLVSATIFDNFDVFGIGKYKASGMRIAGVVVAFAAVVCLKLAAFANKPDAVEVGESADSDEVEMGQMSLCTHADADTEADTGAEAEKPILVSTE